MGEFQGVGEGLAGMVLGWVADPAARLAILRQVWARTTGEVVARRTELLGYGEGELRVRVLDPAWTPILEGMTPELVDRLDEALGGKLVRAISWEV